MKESKRLECLYCQRVAIWTVRFERYVCDDCYAKGLGGDKKKDERSDGTI
mgnify:FL=1|tara:strand:- start:500 stop:649 length:150 start_codon:yes stop_codon:yes gene_type:complete